MKFYHYRPDANNFAGIGLPPSDDNQIVNIHYTDSPLANQWISSATHGFDDNPLVEGDFPSLSNFWRIPVMSQKAWISLSPLIGNCCEALPIVHSTGRPFFIIHVMETIDALDEQRSELWRNPVTGRVGDVTRYSLKHDLLRGKHVFKLPRESGGELIIDEEFRRIVEVNGLRGLLFNELPIIE